jgi:hypothetical protein
MDEILRNISESWESLGDFWQNIIYILIGILLGHFGEGWIDQFREKKKQAKRKKEWDESSKALERYQYLAHGIEVVQSGWEDGFFRDDQVILTLEGQFELPKVLVKEIREPQEDKWIEDGKRNNLQYGIRSLQVPRETETTVSGQPDHTIIVRGHTYSYFDSMSTHFTYLNESFGNEILKQEIDKYLKDHNKDDIDKQEPISILPTPLSIGISLFCEDGNCLVLTRRTSLSSSGGHVAAGRVFNAVGENVNHEQDISGSYKGKTCLSAWRTAKRGLFEEIGIEPTAIHPITIQLHTFVWDRRILDYKMFGYAVVDLSRADIERAFVKAPDFTESKGIFFLETSNVYQCRDVVEKIIRERNNWSSEAIFCTLASLLVYNEKGRDKLSAKDLDELLNKADLNRD